MRFDFGALGKVFPFKFPPTGLTKLSNRE